MTPDEAREIAIRVLRGERFAYTDPFLLTDAAAVLEALGGGISESCAAKRADNPLANSGAKGVEAGVIPPQPFDSAPASPTQGQPQANVEEKKAAWEKAAREWSAWYERNFPTEEPWRWSAEEAALVRTWRALVESEKESGT